jgi:hypothetical protein
MPISVAGTPLSTTESPNNNAALIGGIVGGVFAFLLFGGLIAFFVTRSRRIVNHDDSDAMATNADPALGNYGRIPTKHNNYSDHFDTSSSKQKQYDTLTPNEL